MSPPRIAAVVLAAGMSRRMGRPKALLPLAEEPLIGHVVGRIAQFEAINSVIVVTGHFAQQVEDAIASYPARCIHNPRYANGEMLSSVKVGIEAIVGQCDAFFLVLGDQPGVALETLTAMAQAWKRTGQIVQPTWDGKRGHPILFPAKCAEEIILLPAQAMLKTFMQAQQQATLEVAVDDPEILQDIDTPADYQRALDYYSNQRSKLCEVLPSSDQTPREAKTASVVAAS